MLIPTTPNAMAGQRTEVIRDTWFHKSQNDQAQGFMGEQELPQLKPCDYVGKIWKNTERKTAYIFTDMTHGLWM